MIEGAGFVTPLLLNGVPFVVRIWYCNCKRQLTDPKGERTLVRRHGRHAYYVKLGQGLLSVPTVNHQTQYNALTVTTDPMKNDGKRDWPAGTDEARQIMEAAAQLHMYQLLPAFDGHGRRQEYETQLVGAIVSMEFSINAYPTWVAGVEKVRGTHFR